MSYERNKYVFLRLEFLTKKNEIMAVRMRLQRHGKKGRPFYTIVVADGRAPRDGRFVERLGSYNPLTNPATIDIDIEKALDWLNKGAQPSETVRAILSYKGVLYKKHLLKGVQKGAFSEKQAEDKFDIWLKAKESKIKAKIDGLRQSGTKEKQARLQSEAEVNQKRAAALTAKLRKEMEKAESTETETEVAEAPEAVAVEAVETPEIVAEVTPEATVEVVAEVAPEAIAEEVAEVAPEAIAEEVAEVAPEVKAEEENEEPKAE